MEDLGISKWRMSSFTFVVINTMSKTGEERYYFNLHVKSLSLEIPGEELEQEQRQESRGKLSTALISGPFLLLFLYNPDPPT